MRFNGCGMVSFMVMVVACFVGSNGGFSSWVGSDSGDGRPNTTKELRMRGITIDPQLEDLCGKVMSLKVDNADTPSPSTTHQMT